MAYVEGYEVLLLFSEKIPKIEHWAGSHFETINCEANPYLLGIIVLLSDRATLNNVVDIVSAKSSKISVPVFDSRGILRWPK